MNPSTSPNSNTERPSTAVLLWLYIVFGLIFMMVAVGGITRLTGSGLSMVEWHPLMGTLPPLSAEAWREVFTLYQDSPQYQQVNHWMGLDEFKTIFFWEYVHRLLGRWIGVVFFLPWVYFVARKKLRGRWIGATGLAFILGGSQGLLGWYMVQSGLVDVPEVSHFRLAAHLTLAFLLGQLIWWLALSWRAPERTIAPQRRGLRIAVAGVMFILLLQIVYGAFVAGTRAGLLASTFPDMNGEYLPSGFIPNLHAVISSPLAFHYIHRALGWLLLLAIVGFGVLALVRKHYPSTLRRALGTWSLLATLQFTLGALTVIYHVPVPIAVLHQCGAFVLLSAAVHVAFEAGLLPRLRNSHITQQA